MLANVVWAPAYPSKRSLAIYVHLSGVSCLLPCPYLMCFKYLEPLVTFNFLICTLVPVFAPKFLGGLSTHSLPGSLALLILLEASTHELFDTLQYISICVEETGEEGCP